MSITTRARSGAPAYANLRLTADEYLALPDDGFRYELIDGVVVVSPSPTPKHQKVLLEVTFQLESFLRRHRLGEIFPETDVRFAPDLVYRPELVFLRRERVRRPLERIDVAPDLVVEVLSPSSGPADLKTKKHDYERFGVDEYWMIDPQQVEFHFFRLIDGRYQPVQPDADRFASEAVAGFSLDLEGLRQAIQSI